MSLRQGLTAQRSFPTRVAYAHPSRMAIAKVQHRTHMAMPNSLILEAKTDLLTLSCLLFIYYFILFFF